jgi:glycosyltransferase involved in cell wall biosynthesis
MAKGERNPAKRALLALEGCKMVGYESKICHEFGDVIWVTEEDYNAVALHSLKEHLPCSAIIPICGDPEDSMPVERSAAAKRVTFLGGLHYPPNAQGICWYAEHAFPRVLEAVPDAILTVIGKQPPAELHTFGIPEQNLEVTGFVADPLLYLEETAVFVVPLLAGGGMRVKILDAWVWQMPVVSTTVGAEGIKRRNGENILIADEPEALAESTIFLLQNPSEADRIAHAGRRWVNEYYNWRKLYQDWDSIYKSIPEKVVR